MTPDAPKLPEILAETVSADRAEIALFVAPGLFWFQGHFPGMPILPGVVQVDWALALARRCLALPIETAANLRVKFVAPIVPGDRLVLTLAVEKGRFSFEYRRDGKPCSSGQVPLP